MELGRRDTEPLVVPILPSAGMKISSRTVVLAAAICTSGCGPELEAVDATGKLGQKIDGSGVFDAAYDICLLSRAMTPAAPTVTGSDSCAAEQDAGERWAKITDALSAYAAKLSELATADDVDPTDQVNAVFDEATKIEIGSLTSDQNGAIAGLAGQVVKVLSLSYRKGVLDEVIRNTNPHLQAVKTTLASEVTLRREAIRSLNQTLALLGSAAALPQAPSALPAPPELPAPAQSSLTPAVGDWQRAGSDWEKRLVSELERRQKSQSAMNQVLGQNTNVALQFVRHQLVRRGQAYSDLQTRVVAFAAAHDELAKHVGHLTDKDLAVRVLGVAKAAVKLSAAVKAGSDE